MNQKWDSNISKLLSSAVRNKSGSNSRGANRTGYKEVLQDILEVIKDGEEFDYGNDPKKRLSACKCFLDLWSYLLSSLTILPLNERRLAMHVIVCLMKRREFDPIYFSQFSTLSNYIPTSSAPSTTNPSQSSSSELKPTTSATTKTTLMSSSSKVGSSWWVFGQKTLSKNTATSTTTTTTTTTSSSSTVVSKLEQEITSWYKKMTLSTQDFAVKSLQSDKEKKQNAYQELFSFCASITSINVFRLLNYDQTSSRDRYNKLLKRISSSLMGENIDQELLDTAKKIADENIGIQRDEKIASDREVFEKLFRYCKYYFGEKDYTEIYEIYDDCDSWLPKYEVSSEFYYVFIAEFVTQVYRMMVRTEKFNFGSVPGYLSLMTSYIYKAFNSKKQLNLFANHSNSSNDDAKNNNENSEPNAKNKNNKPVTENKKAIKQWIAISFVLLQNKSFINVLLSLVLPRTRVHEVSECFRCLDTLDAWFAEMKVLDDRPGGINDHCNNLLISALDRLLRTEHFQMLIRTLIFVYNMLDVYTSSGGKQRMKIVYDFLLKEWFYKLFLHWNDDTRTCFHRIIIYKIKRYQRPAFILPTQSKSKKYGLAPHKQFKTYEEDAISLKNKTSSHDGSQKLYRSVSVASGLKRHQETIAGLPDESSMLGLSEEHKAQDATDTVLKSKVDSYVWIVKMSVEEQKETSNKNKNSLPQTLQIPNHLKVYLPRSLREYQEIEQEYKEWKRNADQMFLREQQQLLQYLDTKTMHQTLILSANGYKQTTRAEQILKYYNEFGVPYPIIKFPSFNLKAS